MGDDQNSTESTESTTSTTSTPKTTQEPDIDDLLGPTSNETPSQDDPLKNEPDVLPDVTEPVTGTETTP